MNNSNQKICKNMGRHGVAARRREFAAYRMEFAMMSQIVRECVASCRQEFANVATRSNTSQPATVVRRPTSVGD